MAYVEDTRRRLLHLFERHSHQLGEVIDNPCLDPDDPCFSGWMEASVVKQAYNFDLGPGGFEMPMSDASFCEMVNDIFLFRDKTENCPGWLYIKSCAEVIRAASAAAGSALALSPSDCRRRPTCAATKPLSLRTPPAPAWTALWRTRAACGPTTQSWRA